MDLAAYAPARIATLGLLRAAFGTLVTGTGVLVVYVWAATPSAPRAEGDMPGWWMMLVGLAFAGAGTMLAAGGIGRMVSAFARDCFFRAGPEGIAIRLPRMGRFGRYRIIEHELPWAEIRQFVHFTYRVNFIPVATELRIELGSGESIPIERRYFSASVKKLIQKLQTIQAALGR
jgi:hypothetical protein